MWLSALLVALALGACASGTPDGGRPLGPGPSGAAPSDARGSVGTTARFQRRIAPFDVSGEGGAYSLPFLGGFTAPRPQWVDLDGDGDLDLLVQEYTNRLMYFERVSDEGREPRYVFRTDRLEELDVGEWYRFVDVDGDGDPDLLAEEPFSYMRLYRNRGVGAEPWFELVTDTLRDTAGQPIFSDRQNIPNAADLDCDGLPDVLIGRTVGTITRYEAAAEVGASVPRFEKVTDRFEDIEILGVAGQPPPEDGTAPTPWRSRTSIATATWTSCGETSSRPACS